MNREKSGLTSLTEEDIRKRLYGSAVGIVSAEKEKPRKKHIINHDKVTPVPGKINDEQSKVNEELAKLKRELVETRKKLKRMRGVKTKRIRLLAIFFVVFILGLTLTAAIIRTIMHIKPGIPQVPAAQVSAGTSSSAYAIQVATYENLQPAEKFVSTLKAKGYKPFIYKTQYISGKDKFIVYAGRFRDKKEASNVLNRLKAEEGIEDSFIVNSPS
ncbi:MAG: SPOR domain-containing protein [Candidatus Omnitrophota bacterium]